MKYVIFQYGSGYWDGRGGFTEWPGQAAWYDGSVLEGDWSYPATLIPVTDLDAEDRREQPRPRPVIEDEVWEGDPIYEDFPVKIKVSGVWFIREDKSAAGEQATQDGEHLDPYTQGYSDGYLEGFERGMRHAPDYWLERAAQVVENAAIIPMMHGQKLAAAIRQGGNNE